MLTLYWISSAFKFISLITPNLQNFIMPTLSTEAPTSESPTVWPIVFAILHLLCFIGGFFVAIPIALSKVRFVFLPPANKVAGRQCVQSCLSVILSTGRGCRVTITHDALDLTRQESPPDMLKIVQLGLYCTETPPAPDTPPPPPTCTGTPLARGSLTFPWTCLNMSIMKHFSSHPTGMGFFLLF